MSKRIYPHSTAPGGAVEVPQRLAKIAEAAERYNMDRNYVRHLVESRRVASVKLGKYRFVDLDSLDRLLAAGFTPAEPGGAA